VDLTQCVRAILTTNLASVSAITSETHLLDVVLVVHSARIVRGHLHVLTQTVLILVKTHVACTPAAKSSTTIRFASVLMA